MNELKTALERELDAKCVITESRKKYNVEAIRKSGRHLIQVNKGELNAMIAEAAAKLNGRMV